MGYIFMHKCDYVMPLHSAGDALSCIPISLEQLLPAANKFSVEIWSWIFITAITIIPLFFCRFSFREPATYFMVDFSTFCRAFRWVLPVKCTLALQQRFIKIKEKMNHNIFGERIMHLCTWHQSFGMNMKLFGELFFSRFIYWLFLECWLCVSWINFNSETVRAIFTTQSLQNLRTFMLWFAIFSQNLTILFFFILWKRQIFSIKSAILAGCWAFMLVQTVEELLQFSSNSNVH